MGAYLIKNYLGIYCFRRFVPRELIALIGKREIRRSLKTRCKKTAIRLCRAYSVACDEYFERMRGATMSKDDFKIDIDPKISIGGLHIMPDGAIKIDSVTTDPAHQESESRALKDLLENIDQIAKKRGGSPFPEAVKKIAPLIASKLFSEVFDLFINDRQRYKWIREESGSNYISSYNLFRAIVGDRQIDTYTHEDAEKYRSGLHIVPSGWLRGGTKEKPLSFEEIQKRPQEDTLSTSTISGHLDRMRVFFEFATSRDFTNKQIFNDVDVTVTHNSYEPFTDQELELLFDWSTFSTFQRTNKPSHYWVMLIALFTGARMGEIFFLQVDSIKKDENGIWYFDIISDESRNTKNSQSVRPIPIHSKLISLGFIDFVEQRKADGETARLFPEYKDHNGKAGVKFTDAFKRYRKKCFDAPPRTKVFHSFRHTINNKLQQLASKMNPVMLCRLAGHSTGSMTFDIYGGDFELKDLKEVIELLNFNAELATVPPFVQI